MLHSWQSDISCQKIFLNCDVLAICFSNFKLFLICETLCSDHIQTSTYNNSIGNDS